MISLKSSKPKLISGFNEVIISKKTGWNYWEIMSQPLWFLERIAIYEEAESIVRKIRDAKK